MCWIMGYQSGRFIIMVSLVSVVVLSLGLVACLPSKEAVSAEDIRCCLDSLGEEPDGPDSMREWAYRLGAVLFDGDADRSRFADEIVETYLVCKDVDFLLVYNTGGFGGGTMADDPEWPGVLEGIKSELAAVGYTTVIVEHQRGRGGLVGFVNELEALGREYRTKAPELAAKIAFLTRYNPDLRVITTGRCFGAVISNEVMALGAENPRLYSIQAGRPFWYTETGGERSLVIRDNGVMPDILDSSGILSFLWTLAKANVGRLPSTSPPEEGSFQAVAWYLKAPGHTYTWSHPGVQSRISAFLKQNFG